MKTILLVEDDLELASHWRSLLAEAGHHVVHESTAKAAIEALDSKEADLVIADMMVGSSDGHGPHEGGLEIIAYISLNMDPLPRIIALSDGVGQSTFVDRNFDQSGTLRTLRKPVDDSELLETVELSLQAKGDDRLNELLRANRQLSEDGRLDDLFESSELPKQENALELLKAAQFRLQRTQFSLDNAPEGVYWVDQNARFIYTNLWNCRLLGYSRRELLSMTVMDVNPRVENVEFFRNEMLPRIAAGTFKSEVEQKRKDGSAVLVEVSAKLLDYEGEQIICAYVRDISERKTKEGELLAAKLAAEEGEQRFRSLADSASPLAWTTEADSECSWVNKRWLEYSGKTLEEQQGYGWLSTVHPDDREPAKQAYLNGFNSHSDFHMDYRLRRHDGVFRWHTVNAAPRFAADGNFMGYVGMSFDTHDARIQLQQLRESRNSERTASASNQAMLTLLGTSDGVWDWHIGTEQLNFAPGFRKLLGMEGDDLKSLPNTRAGLDSRIHPADRAEYWASIENGIAEKSPFVHEFRILNATENWIWVRSRGMACYDEQGAAIHLVGSTYDISDAKEALFKLEQKQKALELSNADLAQFAYVASHDLQEPLRAIGGFLQLLEKKYGDQLDEQGLSYISKSVAGAARMSNLINDVLLFSKVGSSDATFGPIDLNLVVGDAIKEREQLISETNTKIEFDNLATVWASKPLLMQIFRNLIGNAIKYKSDSDPHIQITSTVGRRFCTIRVQDNGIGIAPEYQQQVFDLFRRLHHRSEHSGTGIGLAICKRAVDRLGGTISVESNQAAGSCFVVVIPTNDIP